MCAVTSINEDLVEIVEGCLVGILVGVACVGVVLITFLFAVGFPFIIYNLAIDESIYFGSGMGIAVGISCGVHYYFSDNRRSYLGFFQITDNDLVLDLVLLMIVWGIMTSIASLSLSLILLVMPT